VKTLRYFASHYRAQSLLVLLCLLLAGAFEGVGLSALLPILSRIAEDSSDASAADATPSKLNAAVDEALQSVGLEPSLAVLIPIVAGFFWLKAGVLLLAKRQIGYTVARVATDLRLEFLRALMAARWAYYTRLRPGSAANALATEAERASLAYHQLAQVCGHAIETTLYLGLALAISWKVTAGAAVATLLVFGSLGALVRMASRAGRKQTKFLKFLLSRLTDSLQAVKLLKATGRESLIGPLLESDTHRLNVALRHRVFSKEALRALQEPILVTCVCVGFYVGYLMFRIPVAEVGVLAALFAKMMGSSNKMQRGYQAVVMETSALWSLRGLIDQASNDVETLPSGAAPTLERDIEIRGVRVCLDGAVVLDNLSLSIPAGRITALVGESGVGKTTAADLITGLVRPDAGDVYVDGVPMSELDVRRWRELIGYVPQEMLMLHDSVAKNVTLGDPLVTADQLEQALRDAGAWEFVSALPGGIDCSVGERGARLSGGQRQRIAIARALVHGAKLLILDEATAALDPKNEAAVWATIERLRGRTTVLAISHQPALKGVADRIYRIADGGCTEIETSRCSERAAS
jgi:ATP-binding cassette subfamily C protein